MFKCFRNPKAGAYVVGISIAVLAVFLIIVWSKYSSLYESVYHDYATSEHEAARKDKFEESCSGITAVEELRRCFNAHIESGWETQRAQEDLYAQKEMADWTFWTFLVAGLVGVPSVIATIVGVWLVVLNLREAKRVSRLAIDANRHTLQAMRAAELASERELRAYVMVKEIKIENLNRRTPFVIRLEVANFGQTPARGFKIVWGRNIVSKSEIDSFHFYVPNHLHGSRSVLGPGDNNFSRAEFAGYLAPFAYDALRDGRDSILVWGKIWYEDAFGMPRETTFRYACSGRREIGKGSGHLRALPDGNDYT